jgi:NAD-dependent deacetylase
VQLERSGRLHTLVTQNTDGLHRLAGTSPEVLVEIHGTALTCVCWTCGHRQPTSVVLERVRAGEEDPPCLLCGGIMKTATVSFGQSLHPGDLERAHQGVVAAGLLLAIGTTLEVQPISGIVPLARHLGKVVIIVNGSPTAHDDLADVVVRGSISEVIPQLVAVPG